MLGTVFFYPDTQLAVYQACQLCHSVLSALGLASTATGEIVSVNNLKLALILICLLLQLLVIFFLVLIFLQKE